MATPAPATWRYCYKTNSEPDGEFQFSYCNKDTSNGNYRWGKYQDGLPNSFAGNYRDGLRNRAGICPNDAAGRLSMRRSVIRDETRKNPAEASASQETRPQAQTDDAVCHQRKPEDVF